MKFALLVSHILDPLWIIPAVTILKSYSQGFLFSFVLMILMLGIPLTLRYLYWKHDWDISKRKDRPKVIAALLILGCITIFFAKVFGNAAILQVLFFYEIWLTGFLFTSLFFKMSGHTGGMTLATGLLISWYGFAWWPALLLIPIVGWARVVTKNHTPFQVIAGSVYSFFLLFIYEVGQGIF